MKTVSIDGAMGEGGGQVLRSSLTLAMLTGNRVDITRIRAGRPKPGLMRQHRMSVEAAAAICGGEAEGAELGSTSLRFTPGRVRAGDYAFAIATAGSANLVLQTILLPLVLADGPSTVTLEGGTHNPMAPPFDFLVHTFLPVLARMGAKVTLSLERHGFVPAGGGRMTVRIEPVAKLSPVELTSRGPVIKQSGRVIISNLEGKLAYRQRTALAAAMAMSEEDIAVESVRSAGPGNVLQLTIDTGDHCEVVTGFGERRTGTEKIVAEMVREAKGYVESDASVGIHLADQLLLPFAIAGGGRFTTAEVTAHTTTNAKVIESFLPLRVTFEEGARGALVEVGQ